jgi:hypothetical protein
LNTLVHSAARFVRNFPVTIRIVKGTPPSPIGHLVIDYLASCQARGLVPRSLKQYAYALEAVFLPWCEREGITDIAPLPPSPRSQPNGRCLFPMAR